MESLFSISQNSRLADRLRQAWQFHGYGDFSVADSLYETAFASDSSPCTGLEWGKSLRYRGNFSQAISVLSTSWDVAKQQNCRASQLDACCQLIICHRQLQNETGRRQFLQFAIQRVVSAPDCPPFPAVVRLELDKDAGRCFRNCGVRSMAHTDRECHAESLMLQAADAECNADSERADDLWQEAGREFSRLGHFFGTLCAAERHCQLLLAQSRWTEGVTALSVVQHQAEVLGLRTKVADSVRWKGRIQRALHVLQASSHLN